MIFLITFTLTIDVDKQTAEQTQSIIKLKKEGSEIDFIGYSR